jgi:hypothetical protein
MKSLLTVLMVITFITIGCDKKNIDSNDEINNVQTYKSINVKNATDYFSFSNNSGSTDANSDHDIIFFTVQWQPVPQAPVINDPQFKVKDGLSIAVLNSTNLEDVNEVPNTAIFVDNFLSEFGEWYYETDAHLILPYEKVYIVNTADGNFPAFQIKSYYDDMGNSGIYNIDWKYLSE